MVRMIVADQLLAYAKQVDLDYVKKITSDIGKPKWPI